MPVCCQQPQRAALIVLRCGLSRLYRLHGRVQHIQHAGAFLERLDLADQSLCKSELPKRSQHVAMMALQEERIAS